MQHEYYTGLKVNIFTRCHLYARYSGLNVHECTHKIEITLLTRECDGTNMAVR